MKLIVKMMHNSNERLPLEYPIREVLKIYGRRFLIFSIVVVANFVLLGAILLALRYPVPFFVLIFTFLSLFIVLKQWGQVILRTLDLISVDSRSTLAQVQKLGGLSPEELRDAIIALRLRNNIEDEATKFGLATNAIEFVEELKRHTLHLGQILEG